MFGTGGIDALLPNADTGRPGYAALSALPVFVGPNSVLGAGGVEALSNYDALSAIPAYLAPTPAVASASIAAPEGPSTLSTTSTPSTGSGPVSSLVNAVTSALPGQGAGTGWTPSTQGGPVRSLVNAVSSALPKPNAKPAPEAVPQVEEITPTADVPDNSGSGSQNVIRDSLRFTPPSRTASLPSSSAAVARLSTTAFAAGDRPSRSLDSEAGSRPAATAQSSQVLQRIGRALFEPARFFI